MFENTKYNLKNGELVFRRRVIEKRKGAYTQKIACISKERPSGDWILSEKSCLYKLDYLYTIDKTRFFGYL